MRREVNRYVQWLGMGQGGRGVLGLTDRPTQGKRSALGRLSPHLSAQGVTTSLLTWNGPAKWEDS